MSLEIRHWFLCVTWLTVTWGESYDCYDVFLVYFGVFKTCSFYLQTRSFHQSGFIGVQLHVNHALYQSAVACLVQQGAEPLVAPPPFFKPLLPECVERLWLRLSSPRSLIRAQCWRHLLRHGVDLRLQSLSQRSSAEPRPLQRLHVMWHGQEVTQRVQEVQ